MVGLKLLTDAERAGLKVSADGDRLVIRGPKRAEPLALKLIENKIHVLAYLTGHLPPDWHLLWDERAAIMEFDGGLTRERAEALAMDCVLEEMRHAGGGPAP